MPPNIVFVIADQHRWDFPGRADGRTLTPDLDRLAAPNLQPLPNLDCGEYHPL